MKALIVLRLSRVTDESTSIERQREVCHKVCVERGFEVVGYAEDPDVSAGKTSPFERPSLGSWLKQPERFDVLVFYRLDRLVRSARHLHELTGWGEDYSVDLVSATEPEFDTSTPVGRLMVTMTATFAEMELEAIRERTRSSWHHLAGRGLYTGGIPPFGYEKHRDPESDAWVLRPEPEAAELIRSITHRVLDGEALPRIADELTRNGVLSPRDRNHVAQGREARGSGWSTSSLKRCLSNPALLGYSVQGGTVLRSSDGSPVQRAEPILSKSEFDRLQAELDRRAAGKQLSNKKSDSLLLRVLHCGVCGKPMYRLKGGPGRVPRYRCASHQDRLQGPCGNKSVVLADADELVENMVLEIFGGSERLERTWDPGEDHADELDDVNRMLVDLTDQLATGFFRAGTPQRERLDQRIRELSHRQEELSTTVTRTAGWSWKPTGEKFADWWDRLTVPERNQYLRDMGVRAVAKDSAMVASLGELERMAQRLDLDDTAKDVFERSALLEASGSIGQIETELGTFTAYAPETAGPYDEYRERGFSAFVRLGHNRTLALRPEANTEEVAKALTSGDPLPPEAELIDE
ncbi:recombinase family protein [Dietzia maris]|uniref:recombinase family protein n=1 Tax=Dietzia maris TaxID=37915 RepID=UPI00232CFB3E|nr:recombinase family protein [Dietzia maris]